MRPLSFAAGQLFAGCSATTRSWWLQKRPALQTNLCCCCYCCCSGARNGAPRMASESQWPTQSNNTIEYERAGNSFFLSSFTLLPLPLLPDHCWWLITRNSTAALKYTTTALSARGGRFTFRTALTTTTTTGLIKSNGCSSSRSLSLSPEAACLSIYQSARDV